MRLLKGSVSRRKFQTSQPVPATPPAYYSPNVVPFQLDRGVTKLSSKMSTRTSTTSLSDSNTRTHNCRKGGSHQSRRPSLSEILRDEAPAPWTLKAFTAYAARNFCLENLEFLQDADRYQRAYRSIFHSGATSKSDRPKHLRRIGSGQIERLREMWMSLILHYIAPSSPRELNISGDIRTALVPLHKSMDVPHPDHLKPAIDKVFELIEDSILFSFLNDVRSPPSPQDDHTSSEGERSSSKRAHKYSSKKHTSQPAAAHSISFSAGTLSPKNAQYTSMGRSSSHISTKTSHSSNGSIGPTSSASGSIAPALTDDASSLNSPSTTNDLATPPDTPPGSELELHKRMGPNTSRNDDKWKRMSAKFGLRRKPGPRLRNVEEDHFHAAGP